MAMKLTPEMIAQIVAGTLPGWGVSGGDTGNYVGSPESGGAWQASPQGFYQDLPDGRRTSYDAQGNPTEANYEVGESVFNPAEIAQFALAAYGLNGLGGLLGGAGAGAGAAAGGFGSEFGGAAGEILGANTAGYTPGMGLAGASGAAGAGLGATGGADAATSAAWGSGPGLGKDTITAMGAGGAAGGLGLLGDLAKIGIPLAGAVAGAKPTDPADVTKKMDPRLDDAVYGPGGLLSRAKSQFDQSPSGQNATMVQGQQMLRGLLSNPGVMQGLRSMQGTGMGLLNTPMAPNAFAGWKPRG